MPLYPNLESLQSESKPLKMSISLDVAEKMLIKFDGTKSKLNEFIRNADVANSLIDKNLERILFSIIQTKLTDNAAAVTSTRDFRDWLDLKNHLLDIYAEKRTLSQWQLELNSCRQNQHEPVISYANRIENLYVKIINSLDKDFSQEAKKAVVQVLKNQTLHVFITGLNKEFSILVKSQKPDSLENAIAIALAEEQEQKSKFEISKFQNVNSSSKYCHNCHKLGHTTFNCRLNNYQNFKSKSEHKTVRHVQNFNHHNYHSNNNQNPKSNKFCNYCKKPGHLIEECRKRAYNNNRKQKNNTNNPQNFQSSNFSKNEQTPRQQSTSLPRKANIIRAESTM